MRYDTICAIRYYARGYDAIQLVIVHCEAVSRKPVVKHLRLNIFTEDFIFKCYKLEQKNRYEGIAITTLLTTQ